MMNAKLFVMRDRKSGVYGTPFPAPNDECAKREFKAFCRQPQNEYLSEDMELYSVGEFNSDTGVILGNEKPVFLENFSRGE